MVIGGAGIVTSCIILWLLGKKKDWGYCPPVGLSCSDALLYLKPGKNQQKEREVFWRKKLQTCCYVLLSGSILLVLYSAWQTIERDDKPVRQVERPEPGEGKKQVMLSAWTEEGEIPLVIEVGERTLGEEEAKVAVEKTYILLKERIKGENQSLEEVSYPLQLITYMPETACHIYWYIDNTERIDRSGKVYTEGLLQKEPVNLTAEISVGNYKKEYLFSVFVAPIIMNKREQFIYDIKKGVKAAEEKEKTESSFILPAVVGEKKVVYRKPINNQSWVLVALMLVIVGCSMFLPDQRLLQQKKEKEKELMLAYPEIVSKLCLLIGSGLTVRRAWERIIKDYKEAQIFNYAYEEMLLTYYELERGIPEGKAYAAFGRRCRQHGYRKLGSLLEQNLKKGTSGLLALLQEETWQAFEERRAFAVKLAQEAGTRLLFPMVLLLLVVLIICVAPAIMSF